jgi:hypothetical protein
MVSRIDTAGTRDHCDYVENRIRPKNAVFNVIEGHIMAYERLFIAPPYDVLDIDNG